MDFDILYGALIGYLIGSMPMAWLIVRMVFGRDLRREGTGNLGTTNSYEVTGKWSAGALVFAADAAKGAFAVWAAHYYFPWEFAPVAYAAAAAVFGHNFSIWLRFKGGRGLATAAGALAAISPFAVMIWAVLWAMEYYIIHRQVHIANVFATVLTPLMAWAAPDNAIMNMQTLRFWFADDYRIMLLFICLIILARHVKPILELIKTKK
ncbi:MAG: glycerol-3-phosphate acyltransferase [Candidatus Kapaibacterium sp.]